MSNPNRQHSADGPIRRAGRRHGVLAALLPLVAVAGCAGADAVAADHHDGERTPAMRDRVAAMLPNARYQDVSVAEDAGYESSIDTLGCFQNPERGGMGVHYINQDLMDAAIDVTRPEALVYELDVSGQIAGLVAHEYIVPIDAWTSKTPPRLFGVKFHEHPTLPLWVLHAWLWKSNPDGVFEDWNPAVRPCPAGVAVFGTDLPAPATTE
jgi:hypothetical protein